METKSWKTIKDDVYGKKGTPRRDQLEREVAKVMDWWLNRTT
jgi:hypothetical protein